MSPIIPRKTVGVPDYSVGAAIATFIGYSVSVLTMYRYIKGPPEEGQGPQEEQA